MEKSQKKGRDASDYVREVQALTEGYAQEILRENDRLRARVAGIEDDLTLRDRRIADLQDEIMRVLASQQRIERELAETAIVSRGYSERYLEVEMKNRNLASLYVASFQLHGSLERSEVLSAIKEIVANLVGSEELGIFQVHPDGQRLELIDFVGIDPESFRELTVGVGPIGVAAASGQTLMPSGESSVAIGGRPLSAVVPLRLDGKVMGVLAVFRLLEQKRALDSLDYEILEMMATHASSALYCATLHAREQAAKATAA